MFKPSLIAMNFLINLSSNIFLLSVLFRLPIEILSCRLFMVCPICDHIDYAHRFTSEPAMNIMCGVFECDPCCMLAQVMHLGYLHGNVPFSVVCRFWLLLTSLLWRLSVCRNDTNGGSGNKILRSSLSSI